MKLQQLRYLCEIARHDLSFSGAADTLHTSQPGISKQMQLLEQELGVELFLRSGNRIVALTEPGARIVEIAAQVLKQTESIKAAAHEFMHVDAGQLNIASTFTLARYVLPGALKAFVGKYPGVELRLLHGSANAICQIVAAGDADLALATQPTGAFPDLVMLEYARLPRALFVPCHHPLAKEAIVSLDRIAAFPLVTLDAGSHGQARMRELFGRNGIQPNIVLAGPNIDVVKAFVEAGLGIAILPRLAFEAERDSSLRALDLDHLFEPHRASIVIRRNAFLRSFAYDFIQLLAPTLDRRAVATVASAK